MPVIFKKTVATLQGVCTVDEAEQLLEWLAQHPKGKVNLKQCEHLHSAVLQVLMALKPPLSAVPSDPVMASWLLPAISKSDT